MENCSVTLLWQQLENMEQEKRFEGRSYPESMCAFPFKLSGQGFFPGGDGLWRDAVDVAKTSNGLLPVGGVMFVGNDFGTLRTYKRLQAKGYEAPPTWRHLKDRVQRAGIAPELIFCTNAVVGLRSSDTDTALSEKNWQKMESFASFCNEFFLFQVQLLRPKLIVTLGSKTAVTTRALTGVFPSNEMQEVRFDQHLTRLLCMSHPYADFSLSESKLQENADQLRTAWEAVARR